MVAPLSYWCGLYRQFKSRSLCLDIETAGYGKPITVVGLYQPLEFGSLWFS
ncbi:MAG: hypothetical protein HYZ36_07050 [Pedosphaera parvula]|nr:hypothetical protein [Pedosphaera parvula]